MTVKSGRLRWEGGVACIMKIMCTALIRKPEWKICKWKFVDVINLIQNRDSEWLLQSQ